MIRSAYSQPSISTRLALALGASLLLHAALLGDWQRSKSPAQKPPPLQASFKAPPPPPPPPAPELHLDDGPRTAPVPEKKPEPPKPKQPPKAEPPKPPVKTPPPAKAPPPKAPEPKAPPPRPTPAKPVPAKAPPPPSRSTLAPPAAQEANRQLAKMAAKEGFYPVEAIRRGLEGEALVQLFLDPDGNVVAARIEQSSGHPILDQAALRAVRAIRGLPAAGADEALLPVRFRLE